jgi:DNA topoisomerase-6 subunit B
VPVQSSLELDQSQAPAEKLKTRQTAESMATRQREISISEFFSKNRHLLGFDNPQKALLTAVKEAVDNSLDACEDAGILPTLRVNIQQLAEERFRIAVEDNGPGIVKAQIPKIFGKLLYGSKFHTLKQSAFPPPACMDC